MPLNAETGCSTLIELGVSHVAAPRITLPKWEAIGADRGAVRERGEEWGAGVGRRIECLPGDDINVVRVDQPSPCAA
jgi:hypothetical protein